MIEIFKSGGIMMYPLLLSSILGLTIIIERFIVLRKKKILVPEITAVIDKINEIENFSLVRSVCEKFKGPFSQITMSCIDNRDLPPEELRVLIEDEGRQQVRTLNRGLGTIETIAGIAPLMGLLGTVIGMIKVFDIIQSLGVGQARALSGGISEALITTAAGLMIGIPALIFYNYLNSRSESLILDIEKYIVLLLNKIVRLNHKSEEKTGINLRAK
jgi:biopolymer transport protein ExbB